MTVVNGGATRTKVYSYGPPPCLTRIFDVQLRQGSVPWPRPRERKVAAQIRKTSFSLVRYRLAAGRPHEPVPSPAASGQASLGPSFRRQSPQFSVDQRQQLLGCPGVTLLDRGEDSRDVAHSGSKGTFKAIPEHSCMLTAEST